jgi:integrase
MPHPRPPKLEKQVTRHGTTVWYVRAQHHGARVRIRAEFGSEAFWEEYRAAMAGAGGRPKAKPSGSLGWLWDRYRASLAWRKLSAATRKARENAMAPILAESKDRPAAKVRKVDLEATRDKIAAPHQARVVMDCMRGMYRWAVVALSDQFKDDPTASIKNPKAVRTEGFPVWAEEEVDRYQARWKLGTKERVWLDVLLYTGLRRGDAVRLGRQHVREGFWTIKTEKSGFQVEVTNPVLPVLQSTLDAGPTGDLTFICGAGGRPLTKETFGNVFRHACNQAGVMGKSAHGLRKVAATRSAENGATTQQLMALFGWLSQKQAELYTRSADRKRMSRDAGAFMQRTQVEQISPSPDPKVRADG